MQLMFLKLNVFGPHQNSYYFIFRIHQRDWHIVKIENAKIQNVKNENVEIENVKIENVKIDNEKIKNVKFKIGCRVWASVLTY